METMHLKRELKVEYKAFHPLRPTRDRDASKKRIESPTLQPMVLAPETLDASKKRIESPERYREPTYVPRTDASKKRIESHPQPYPYLPLP